MIKKNMTDFRNGLSLDDTLTNVNCWRGVGVGGGGVGLSFVVQLKHIMRYSIKTCDLK